ncbi:hypothetical protein Cgig2_023665 [Carnegiea gigantea]|uniref:Phospholipase/carboxylesterase/thioesterase domain-containing protein n=1 Tax=Carnegiea gigantea TaxID=171969 RepID=A0A9Q1KL08_9CARY|nr:hypothetical protein Cgig2_023665 [Carnegiea gigantea]
MSFSGPSIGSGVKAAQKAYEFGRTYIVRPKGKHQATIVWLHGLGDHGGRSNGYAQLLRHDQLVYLVAFPQLLAMATECMPPSPPTLLPFFVKAQPSCMIVKHGFNVIDLSEDAPDDVEGLDASAAHVVNLLSPEPTDIKFAVGGFSMGAAVALHAAMCCVTSKYANGNPFPANLRAAVGLSGWLPCAKSLSNKLATNEALNHAACLPILLCHGKVDDVVPYKYGKKSSEVLASRGFRDLTFKSYDGLGHYTYPEEIEDLCEWLKSKLNLDGH